MGKRLNGPKDIVRIRSGNKCEKCKAKLTKNVNGIPSDGAARSIHHRQPVRNGGHDSVINMVNLCITCHRGIHADEESARTEGWITHNPARSPFLGWRGWVVPDTVGGLLLLDFESGRAWEVETGCSAPAPDDPRDARPRRRVARRDRFDKPREKTRRAARAA